MIKMDFENGKTKLNKDTMDTFQDNIAKAINDRGTWTPRLVNVKDGGTDPTVTYTERRGTYVKVDKLVIAFFVLKGSITNVQSGNYAALGGLPYDVRDALGLGSVTSAYNILTQLGGEAITCLPTFLARGGNTVQIQSADSLGSAIASFKITNQFEFIGGFIYETL